MDWGWHVVLFCFMWFVLADTFYEYEPLWVSFGATFLWYPLLLLTSQLLS